MKQKIIIALATASLSMSVMAHAASSSSPSAATLNSQMDKVSYAIGYDIGKGFKTQSIGVETSPFESGFEAGIGGNTPVMTDADMQTTLTSFQKEMMQQAMQKQQAQAATNLQASQAYLAKMAAMPGVKQLAPGLYYQVMTKGSGAIPGPKDIVTVNYAGTLPDGTVFDSSYQRGQPASFEVDQVIPGWSKTLQKMPVGSTWMVYIAPDLAYGVYAPPQIGPNQALTFKIELISVKSASAAASSADSQ